MRPADSFSVLGVEPRFDLTVRELRSAWMRRAAASHPDAAGAVDESARVNDAMRLLSDPIQRAQALLELRGAPEVGSRPVPQEFLLEMMELRERADLSADDPAAMATLRSEAEERRAAAIASIAAAFAESPSGPISMEAARRVADGLHVVRFFTRMIEQLDRESGAGSAT